MKIYVTPTELDKLKGILSDYDYLEGVKYTQVSSVDYKDFKQQRVDIRCSEFVKRKIRSYLIYYIYPFREKK